MNDEIQLSVIDDNGERIILSKEQKENELQNCKVYQMFKEDIELQNYFFHELTLLKEKWTCYSEAPERTVYTKREPGQNILSVFFKFKVPTNLFYPLALLSEVDLFQHWMPYILRSEIMHNYSDFRKGLFVERQFPFPLSNRVLILAASAYLVKERKGAMIMIRSFNDARKQNWGFDSNQIPKHNLVEATMERGFMYIEHIDDNSCWYHGMININPNFTFIPDWILNFTVKRMIYVIVGKLQNKDFFENEMIKKRMAERPEFYERVKNRLREFSNI
ncbi:UNKNOWN [Stylonychia lemnae]|uniref:START domain-containing protein n=1 Tax=Stylonychia lemnae TaxID=5949 RepID=A0A078ALN3_STYLE|nr:UNKNOWN [Stylonychia lemnae]|eukprot:CDW82781.1 UNKNOWN [Stylonychia lemnae]